MKELYFIATFYICLISIGCSSQSKDIKIKEIKFESIFGYPKDSSCTYCLLGSGFFRAPRADNTDSLITQWIVKHPEAVIFPVSALKEKEKLVYCWVIDQADTLNTTLIKNGCYPGGTMLGFRKNSSLNEVYISKETYDKFIEQIKSAEIFAKENKLGIWAKKESFE